MSALLLLLLLQTAEAPKPAVLRGHVTELGSGVPVKRAQVTLRDATRQDEQVTVFTDAKGAFEFREAPEGAYRLICTRLNFVTSHWGEVAPGRGGDVLQVRAGQEIKDLDFRLLRAGVIRGAVTDEEGEPISGASVQLLMRVYERGRPVYSSRGASAYTNDLGEYRLFGIRPGKYFILATRRGVGDPSVPSYINYATIFHPTALRIEDAQPVEVGAGGDVRVDFSLRPVEVRKISGRVVDAMTGAPVAKANISLGHESFGMTRFSGPGYSSGPDGRFEIKGLTPGNYRLQPSVNSGDGVYRRGAEMQVLVSEQDVTDLVLTAGPGVTVSGRVVAGGEPFKPQSLRVVLMSRRSRTGQGIGIVQDDASFRIAEVQPGAYDVAFSGPPAAFYLREVRDARGDNPLETGVQVGAEPVTLDLILDHHGGTVAGRVVNESGQPVKGVLAALMLADPEAPPERAFADRFFRTAISDREGKFAIRAIIPGEYLLLAWPDLDSGLLQDPDVISQVRRYARWVRVERDARLQEDVKIAPEVRRIAQKVLP